MDFREHDKFSMSERVENKGVKIDCYISKLSGARVTLVSVDSPVLCTYITLLTEAHDDKGMPHTLEHLIFLGSRKYPYKGVLDLLANRCLSDGTNAWTATDHTTYTISCLGLEALSRILPVYLDHIMCPTLAEGAYLTEVHHKTPEGEDAGVVYSEMESRENTAEEVVNRAILKSMYPKESGYRYETGGLLSGIKALTNKEVNAYHEQFYRWENVNIIIAGRVSDRDSILDLIAASEAETYCKEKLTPFTRPWTDKRNWAPNREEDVLDEKSGEKKDKTVTFPDDSLYTGRLSFAWRGCEWANFEEVEVIDLLGLYLTEGNTAPLMRFVDRDEPLCSAVSFSQESFKTTYLELYFENIECAEEQEEGGDHMHQLVSEVKLYLQEMSENFAKGSFDLNRMKSIIEREALQFQRSLEEDPHDTCAQIINECTVNGACGDLDKLIHLDRIYANLSAKGVDFWVERYNFYFIQQYPSVVQGVPHQVDNPLGAAPEEKKNNINLGENIDLVAMTKAVGEAKRVQSIAPPEGVLAAVPFCVFSGQDLTGLEVVWGEEDYSSCLRLYVPLLNSDFVCLKLLARIPDELTMEQKLLLPLLCELLFETDINLSASLDSAVISDVEPVRKVLSHKELTEALLRSTIDYDACVGFGGDSFRPSDCPELLVISMNLPHSRLEEGTRLFEGVVRNTKFDLRRIRNKINKLTSDVQKERSCPKAFVDLIDTHLRYPCDSLYSLCSIAQQPHGCKALALDVDTLLEPVGKEETKLYLDDTLDCENLKNLKILYDSVLVSNPRPLVLFHTGKESEQVCHLSQFLGGKLDGKKLVQKHVASKNVEKSIEKPSRKSAQNDGEGNRQKKLRNESNKSLEKNPIPHSLREKLALCDGSPTSEWRIAHLNNKGNFHRSIFVGLGSCDATHIMWSTNGPIGFDHSEVPALMVLSEMFSCMEGPLYREIRGAGYAYGCDLSHYPSNGDIRLRISPSVEGPKSLKVALEVFAGYINKTLVFTQDHLKAAISACTYTVVKSFESTAASKAYRRVLNACRGVSMDHVKILLEEIGKVRLEEIEILIKKYLNPFVQFKGLQNPFPPSTTLAVVGKWDKIDKIAQEIKEKSGISGSVLTKKIFLKYIKNHQLDFSSQLPPQSDTSHSESEISCSDSEESDA